MSIYAPGRSSHGITALPQAVYDAIANPAVTSYKVATGRYTIADAANYISMGRGNLDLDFGGSSIITTPLGYVFYMESNIDEFVDEAAPARDASHLTGTITEETTQLTMDEDEVMDLQAGEEVTIVAGVNESDPVEPARFITATVEGVANRVITFTAPLGEDIRVYANEAELEALVSPSLHDKIGTWGEDYNTGSNYKKGLGTDHGLMRYVNRARTSNITIRNFHLENRMPNDNTIIVGAANFFCKDIDNLTIKDFSVNNVVVALMHCWRCDDVLVDRAKIRGTGRSLIFEPDTTFTGTVFTGWGGDGLTFRDVSIVGKNMALANYEVSTRNLLFQNLGYSNVYTQNWSYVSDSVPLGFFGDINARFEDSIFNVSGAAGWAWDAGIPCTFENLTFTTNFGDPFDFALHTIEGTVKVGAVTYGPLVQDAETVNVPGGEFISRVITLPKGFYKSGRLRVTVQGGAAEMADQFGNTYTQILDDGGVTWTNFISTQWFIPTATGNLTSLYFDNQAFNVNLHTAPQCTIEFEIEYYPAPDNPGWSVT